MDPWAPLERFSLDVLLVVWMVERAGTWCFAKQGQKPPARMGACEVPGWRR